MNSDSAEMNNQQEEDNDDDTPSESANTELVTPNSKSTGQNSKQDSNGRRQRTYFRIF